MRIVTERTELGGGVKVGVRSPGMVKLDVLLAGHTARQPREES